MSEGDITGFILSGTRFDVVPGSVHERHQFCDAELVPLSAAPTDRRLITIYNNAIEAVIRRPRSEDA